MSEPADTPRDPRRRPADPAGTRPKVDPRSLLPSRPLDAARAGGDVVEGEAVEELDEAVAAAEGGDGPAPSGGDGDLLPERRAAAGIGAVAASPPPPHQARFHFLYGALAALAAAALAVIAVVAAGGGRDTVTQRLAAWSSWHPTEGDLAGASQIAAHVGRSYRFSGRQLVNVEASAMDFEGIPLSVALRETPAQGGDIRVFGDSGYIYRLCGLGPSCSIADGKPSVERHLLLRREALELALYSFRYLDGADQVVVLMPPPPGQKPSQAVFFRRGDVVSELDRPLAASLASRTPTVRTIRLSRDASLVDRLTGARLFTFSLTQANTENRGFLVLDPITAAAKQPAKQPSTQPAKQSAKKQK
ncbi:MAG TPA: hypothetical protein VLA98_04025 [Solirubrobacteraceae bacterium]|nr:hypothetical protein [Solirubrobacteraceae bacterium]